jgi:GNAT superfamily N-acetyltransferase
MSPSIVQVLQNAPGRVWHDFEKLYNISFDEHDKDPIEIYKNAVRTGETDLFVLVFNTEMIGYATIDVCEKIIILHHIFIREEYRKYGYSKLLLNKIKTLSLQLNKPLFLECQTELLEYYYKQNFNLFTKDYFIPDFSSEEILQYNLVCFNFLACSNFSITCLLDELYYRTYYLDSSSECYQKTLEATINKEK